MAQVSIDLDNCSVGTLRRRLRRAQSDMQIMASMNRQQNKLHEHMDHGAQEQQHYIDLFLENTPDVIIVIDKDFNILFASKQVHPDKYRTLEELSVNYFREDDDIFDDDRMMNKVKRVFATRQILNWTRKMEYHGKMLTHSCKAIPTAIGGGDVDAVILMFHEITDLVEAMEKVEAADKSKTAFLANMSHEIRTPMNAIVGMSEFILRDSTDPVAKDNAMQIKRSSQSLLAIINDILDFSKIESGKMEVINSNYHITSIIKDVSGMIKFRLQDKPVELKLDISPELPTEIVGDEVRIKQVLINLMNNAVKFTNSGSITLKVWHEMNQEYNDATIYFAVTDTGIGIKEEDMCKLFTNFQQVDTKRNRSVEGTGLGLAISQRLSTLMGGRVFVESKYGEGSTFTFCVRNTVINFTPIGDFNKSVASNETKAFEISMECPEASVLIVDDSAVNLKVASGLMKPYKIKVTTAKSGPDAIELAKENTYDIIFMDHMMPGMDGVETSHIIRDNDGDSKARIIVALTANAVAGSKEMYENEGFDDFLAKPIELEKLDAVLRRFIHSSKIVELERNTASAVEAQKLATAGPSAGTVQSVDSVAMATPATGDSTETGLYTGPGSELAPKLKEAIKNFDMKELMRLLDEFDATTDEAGRKMSRLFRSSINAYDYEGVLELFKKYFGEYDS